MEDEFSLILFVGAAWLQVARKAILLRCRCVFDYEVSVFSDLARTHALTHILRRFLVSESMVKMVQWNFL